MRKWFINMVIPQQGKDHSWGYDPATISLNVSDVENQEDYGSMHEVLVERICVSLKVWIQEGEQSLTRMAPT